MKTEEGRQMFNELKEINSKPKPFELYTAEELWTNEHTAQQMLQYHLNEEVDLSSRNRKFIESSVEWIASRFNIDETKKIADFGCGPGLYAMRLAKHGAGVTGIDFSENSLRYARKTAELERLPIEYIHANYLEFETSKRFDLIMMIMCDFCSLSPKQRKLMLEKFHSFLKPGGSVLLDVYSLNVFKQREESAAYELNQLDGFWSPMDYWCFVNTFKYEEEKVILDKYTIVEETGMRVVYNWQQAFSRESLQDEFTTSGFTVEELFSNVAGMPFDKNAPEIAIIATKK